MEKPCLKCSAYDKWQDQCGVLLKLQALHLVKLRNHERDERLTSRTAPLDELLIQRPCRFSLYIMRWASYFVNKRGLKLQDETDIHNDVVASLLKLNFRLVEPAYDDFRRYVIAMTRSAAHRGFAQLHGNHCCGTCAFFQEGTKQCGCADLKPVLGLERIHINYSTKPGDVIHNSMVSLGPDEVLNWVGFCAWLSKERDETSPSSSKRIWELLSQEVQEDILNAARTGKVVETFKFSLVEALNSVLRRPDFYQEKSFRHLTLTSEARKFLAQSQPALSQIKTQRLNRLLLEASCPDEIAKSYKGCPHYSSKQLVDISDLSSLVTPGDRDVEDTLKYMESVGPRQRKLARLLRLMLEGYEISEIALQTGKHRTTIPKELYGTSERDKDEKGEEIPYHQAGAFEIFRAIYTGAIFILEREEKHLWSVVTRRDFNFTAVQPGFSKISGELKLSKRKTVERYIDGWSWIKAQPTRGGGSVSRFEDDNQKRKQTLLVSMSRAAHPDFQVLLAYAEGSLDQDIRKQIAGHVLICEHCSAELEPLETLIVPEIERPIGMVERGRWFAGRISGRLAKARGVANREDNASILNRSRLSMSLTYALALAVVGLLLLLVLRETNYNSSYDQLNALKQQNEMLHQEIARLRTEEQAQQERLASDLRASEQRKAELEHELATLKTLSAQRPASLPQVVTVEDTQGIVTVGRDVIINPAEDTSIKLPPDLSRSVRQFVAGNVNTTEPADSALTTIREAAKRGASRSGGTSEHLKALPRSPVLTAVRTTRPTLKWLPVSGAQSYEVIVSRYPSGEKWSKDVGTQTETTVDADFLSPGQIYLWEVVTKMSDRDEVSSTAGFLVLDEKSLRDVEILEQRYKSSALVLSTVYVKYGLYEEAVSQITQLKVQNPTSRFLEKMLQKLQRQIRKR